MVLGILFFTFNIMFLLQTLSAGQGYIADRFTYIAYFGLFLIYASWLQWALEHYTEFDRWIYLVVFLVLVIYGSINFEQNKIWKNEETLWSHQIKHHPEVFLPWIYRAVLYREEGQLNKALHDHNKAIALKPLDASAYVSRGVTFFRFNMFEKALQDFDAAEKGLFDAGHFIERDLTFTSNLATTVKHSLSLKNIYALIILIQKCGQSWE